MWPRLLSSFCVDPSPANPRHPDYTVPGCICPCHSRRELPPTWKLKSRRVMPSNNAEDFNPSRENLSLMEKLERLGSNRDGTRAPSRKG